VLELIISHGVLWNRPMDIEGMHNEKESPRCSRLWQPGSLAGKPSEATTTLKVSRSNTRNSIKPNGNVHFN
jgi:hypothetical protein